MEILTEIFDYLPISEIIDGKIFVFMWDYHLRLQTIDEIRSAT